MANSIIDPNSVSFDKERGPALASACMMCAAAAGTEVLKLITGRGKIAHAGRGIYYDTLRNRMLPLKKCSSVRHSMLGRFKRWVVFRRVHGLRKMHDQEMLERAGASAAPELPTVAVN